MAGISFGLEGKVAVITGGSRGIGLEIARHLIKEKIGVAICGRKTEGLEAAAAALGPGADVLTVQAHVAREAEVQALMDQVRARWGGLDILINNVGMNIFTPSVVETEPALWQKILDTNLNGAFLCARAAVPLMKERKSGKIVNLTSLAAFRAALGMGVYGIAKAGIEMLTRVLAAELGPLNIQVNAVAPAMVKTDFSKPFWTNEQIHAEIVKGIPMGRLAEPADVVPPVLFLASSGANFITGQTLMVDGGAMAI